MTNPDRLLPVPDDDALDAAASAVVDGVATPEEEAAIAAAPDGASRVAAQRAVAQAVGRPAGEQDPDAAARARAAAIAAFGAEPASEAGPVAPVVGMPSPRSNRALPRLGAVAAALLLLVGIGTFAVAVVRSGDSNDTTTFSAAPPAKEAAEESIGSGAGGATSGPAATAATGSANALAAPPTAPPPPAAGAAAPAADARTVATPAPPPPPTAPVNGGEIGRQDDLEAVALQAKKALDGTPNAVAPTGDPALPSDVLACVNAGVRTAPETLGALRYRATGSYQGRAAFFLAYDRPSNATPYYLLALERNGCSILDFTHF